MELKGKYVGDAGTQERSGRKRFGLREGSTRGGGGGAPSPCCRIVLAVLEKVLPVKEVYSCSFKKLPRLGCDGNSSKVLECLCMQLFEQQGEGKERRVEVHISKMSEY